MGAVNLMSLSYFHKGISIDNSYKGLRQVTLTILISTWPCHIMCVEDSSPKQIFCLPVTLPTTDFAPPSTLLLI